MYVLHVYTPIEACNTKHVEPGFYDSQTTVTGKRLDLFRQQQQHSRMGLYKVQKVYCSRMFSRYTFSNLLFNPIYCPLSNKCFAAAYIVLINEYIYYNTVRTALVTIT